MEVLRPVASGLPENGGGYDTERLNFLNDVDPNLPIRFSWSYEFQAPLDKWIEEEEEEEFVPFYQGRSLGQSTDLPVPQPPRLNPFDQAQPIRFLGPTPSIP